MQGKAFLTRFLIAILTLVLTVPAGVFAQGSGSRTLFSEEELDQMLAPVALYPDALLAQVLVAATFPEQVEEADRWLKSNPGLEGDRLNDAVDRKDWDLSVKALVPFPKVLEMMSDKREWTQNLGEAFLAQEADVMDTVQKLRSKAYAQGNLKTTEQQKVVVKGDYIEIEPYAPTRIYVPVYNPVVVYGPWWWPAYQPYAYSPWYPGYVYSPGYVVPGFVAAGAFGFAAGIAVGAAWHHGWGHWDWGHRSAVVNVNRNVNINRTNITNIRTTNINRAVQQGKIGSKTTRAAVQQRKAAAPARGSVRQGAKGVTGPGKRPSAASVEKGLKQREGTGRAGAGKAAVGEGKAGARGGKASMREGQQGARGGKASMREGQPGARGGKASVREGQRRGPEKEMRRGGDRSMQRERGAIRGGAGAGAGGGKALRGGEARPRGGAQNIQRGGGGQRAPEKAQRGGGGERRERRQ